MQTKSLVLLVLALGCGVIASIGITQVMANRSSPPPPPQLETQPVFVALKEIPMGTLLDPQLVKLEQWPKDRIPEGVLSKLEDIEGRRPRTKLFAGEPILDVKLLSKGESAGGAAPMIPIGYRAVPVRVDDVSGGAAMILPGDRVDVLIHVKRGNEITSTVTKTILQDVKAFAVDSQWTMESDESGKAIRAKTISLLLTPEQTERVMMAHELGKIRLALRSPEDHEEAELPEGGHRISHLLGDADIADHQRDATLMKPGQLVAQATAAPPVELPAEPPAEPPAELPVELPAEPVDVRPSHLIRVISGSAVSEIELQGPAEDAAAGEDALGISSIWRIIPRPARPDSPTQEKTTDPPKPRADNRIDAPPLPRMIPAGNA